LFLNLQKDTRLIHPIAFTEGKHNGSK